MSIASFHSDVNDDMRIPQAIEELCAMLVPLTVDGVKKHRISRHCI